MYAQRKNLGRSAVFDLCKWQGNSPRRKTHVGFHVKCPLLLSDLNHSWNVSTDFTTTPQYKIACKSFNLFWSSYMRTHGRNDAEV
jgi:hypothetical protein